MDTRERILETAARLFHRQGFAATGVAAILRETGINSGSLYHFFDGKDALLEGVLQWYLEETYPRIMAPIEQQEPDPIERVFRLLDWYRSFLLENACRLGCPIANLALEVSDTHPEQRVHVDRIFRNWKSVIERWLDEGRERLPPGSDTGRLACFVLAVMEGGVMQARVAGSLTPFDDSVVELRAYFDVLQSGAGRQQIAEPLARTA
jgi:AcrR family transcriptional regulator